MLSFAPGAFRRKSAALDSQNPKGRNPKRLVVHYNKDNETNGRAFFRPRRDKAAVTVTVNGKAFTHLTDKTTSTKTATTPAGRTVEAGYDPNTGLTTYTRIPGLADTDFGYDPRGRLTRVAAGTRQSTFTYDAAGNLATATDPENRITAFDYDPMGRLTALRPPDNATLRFDYNANGSRIYERNLLRGIERDLSYSVEPTFRTPPSSYWI